MLGHVSPSKAHGSVVTKATQCSQTIWQFCMNLPNVDNQLGVLIEEPRDYCSVVHSDY